MTTSISVEKAMHEAANCKLQPLLGDCSAFNVGHIHLAYGDHTPAALAEALMQNVVPLRSAEDTDQKQSMKFILSWTLEQMGREDYKAFLTHFRKVGKVNITETLGWQGHPFFLIIITFRKNPDYRGRTMYDRSPKKFEGYTIDGNALLPSRAAMDIKRKALTW